MNKKIKSNPIALVNMILGLVLALTPFVLFPVCNRLMKNGKPMMCFYSGKLIVGLAIGILIVNAIAIFANKKGVSIGAYILSIVLASICYLAPNRIIEIGHKKIDGWEIGLCKGGHHMSGAMEMTCMTKTMPAVTVLVSLIVIVCLVGFIFSFVRKN